MTKAKIYFPWLSIFSLSALLVFFSIAPDTLISVGDSPLYDPNNHFVTAILFLLVTLVIIADFRRFYRQKKIYDHTIEELFRAKKSLQKKAHTYGGHSEKLKLFISDRLLEYIQYDEKFLHFKNIAAEVRHNGVICFDKVQRSLNTAINNQTTNDKNTTEKALDSNQYHDALNSMRYLWDLLDLSTTDNIALHIANHLCECEEHYFQSLLHKDIKKENSSVTQNTPYKPTFIAHKVLVDCIMPLIDAPENLLFDDTSTQYEHDSEIQSNRKNDLAVSYSDATFHIQLDANIELLGNKNHFQLLIENLINNAQFYLKKKYMPKYQAGIAIELTEKDMQLHLSVYNRGRFIPNEDKDKVFQLGYSTRRKKENHGKGLGLYFVNSIVQGYEGHINFINVQNQSDTYSIRIQLESNQILTGIVETTLIEDQATGNQPMILNPDSDQLEKHAEWKTSESVTNLEVFSKRFNKTHRFNVSADQNDTPYVDQDNSSMPTWSIIINKRRRTSTITFTPLNINGVQFLVTLPTAKARLNYSEDINYNDEENNYDDIIDMENQFKN